MPKRAKRFNILKTGRPPVVRYLVISLGVIGLVGAMLWTSLIDAIDNRNNLSLLYSRIIESSLTRTLESVENSLFPLLQDLDAQGSGDMNWDQLQKRVENIIFFAPHIRQIVILRDGQTLFDSNRRAKGDVDLSRLRFPKRETTHMTLGLKIGETVQGRYLPTVGEQVRESRRSLVPLIFESTRPGGSPYQLVVGLNTQYLEGIFKSLTYEKGDGFALYRGDGKLLIGRDQDVLSPDIDRLILDATKLGKDERLYVERGVVHPRYQEIIRLSTKYPLAIVLHTNHVASRGHWADKNIILIMALVAATLGVLIAIYFLYLDAIRTRNLKKEIALLSAAVHQSPVSVLITDVMGHIKYANAAFQKVYGYEPNDVLDKTPAILKSGTTPKAVYDELWADLKAGKSWQGEFLNKTRNGDLVPTATAISPVIDEDGEYTHIVGILADISDQKELQERALEMSEQAKMASQAKSNFLATMSHELRTPMTGIRGVIDLMKSKTLKPEEVSDLLEELDTSSNALMMLLNDILDLSKIEAGKLQVEILPTNPAQILRNVVHLFQENAEHKGVLLSCQVKSTQSYWILSDGLRLRQIFSNLISNAVKFTTEGSIKVKLEVEQEDDTHVHLRLLIHDTGIGMTDNQLQTVFEPFTQADSSTTRKFGGTGLGLTITKQLCERLGGTLNVESEEGVGTTFVVHLSAEMTEAPAVPDHHAVQLKPLSILLAEDNMVNQKIVSTMLRKKGHRIELAENGRVAVEKANTQAFDIILMDMQMPEMDGLSATRLIRGSSKHNKNTAILAFTADAFPEHHAQFGEVGINDVVTKPVRWALLEQKLAEHAPAPSLHLQE